MSLPDVPVSFSNGNLGILPANTDGVFAVIGASSLGAVNTVIPIVDPNAIPGTIGYGPLAEAVAQVFANTSTVVYAVPGTKTAGTVPNSAAQSRTAAPALVPSALLGLPTAPFAAAPGNTGTGSVSFDATTTPVLSSTASTASVVVTTPGALGTAHADITIGNTVHSDQPLTVTPWTDPGGSGVVLDFTTPLGGTFQIGDTFTAVATPNDGYNVLISVLSTDAQGGMQWTLSLDGGVTVSAPISAFIGCTVVATGSTKPTLTFGGSAPAAPHGVKIACTQQGTALGIAAQCSNSSGVLSRAGTGLATATVTTPSTAATVQAVTLNITNTGTAAGTSNSSDTTTGTGTAGGNIIIGGNTYTFANGQFPATFTDSVSGLVFAFASGPGNFTNGDVYRITVQAPAIFTFTVDGTPTTGVYVNSSGHPSNSSGTALNPQIPGVVGPTLTFGHTNTDIFTYSSGTPANTTVYNFTLAPAYSYQPRERNNSLVGLNLAFGFGTYQAGDAYAFSCTPPSVAPTNAVNALNAALLAQGVNFSMAHFACEPDSFATAATLASDVQSVLATEANAPAYRFISSVVYGPSKTTTSNGARVTDFIGSTINLSLDRVGMTCGADYITSALTQRQDLRNCGYVITARLAVDPVEQDPGAVSDGALTNDVRTTTPLSDATQIDANRGMTTRTFSGLTGVYVSEGLTLAGVGSDYSTVENRRVIDKCARVGRAALLPRVNTRVRTIPGPSTDPATGTINPTDAAAINNDVQGKIANACNGNIQNVTVAVSRTSKVISNSTLPVTISVLPFAYVRYIPVTIGFVPG